jgi:hypothetical protein
MHRNPTALHQQQPAKWGKMKGNGILMLPQQSCNGWRLIRIWIPCVERGWEKQKKLASLYFDEKQFMQTRSFTLPLSQARSKIRHGFVWNTQKKKIRALYAVRLLCCVHHHRRWFNASPEAHFAIESHLHRLQAWIRSYGEMIMAISIWQQHNNQQGQMGITEAFGPLYNI